MPRPTDSELVAFLREVKPRLYDILVEKWQEENGFRVHPGQRDGAVVTAYARGEVFVKDIGLEDVGSEFGYNQEDDCLPPRAEAGTPKDNLCSCKPGEVYNNLLCVVHEKPNREPLF